MVLVPQSDDHTSGNIAVIYTASVHVKSSFSYMLKGASFIPIPTNLFFSKRVGRWLEDRFPENGKFLQVDYSPVEFLDKIVEIESKIAGVSLWINVSDHEEQVFIYCHHEGGSFHF